MFEQPTPTLHRDGDALLILDQTALPFHTRTLRLATLAEAVHAIRAMQVRGAPLIGATAAHGIALALLRESGDAALDRALQMLGATRPTAVNLHWALARMDKALRPLPPAARVNAAWAEAEAIRVDDAATCDAIGRHGLALIEAVAARRPGPVRLMTHCNAGWLATCGAGTALAPVYAAQAAGIAVEVFVSETRPRNQGLLTAWELAAAGVPHVLIADNAAGLLLMRGEVDMVITGADRIAANGDTANKVGTWLKALAAQAAGVPFYIAAPHSTLDFACPDGPSIPIEDRGAEEICMLRGIDAAGAIAELRQAPPGTRTANPAFDVTPATLITGIITERGVVEPAALAGRYPEAAR
ncbi:S-methyl-5-thioribose-1-phosphate isomerase [Thauera linaloolentis]|uniref:Methylthioribose-1-phosphate isomerase n=1 Tax=Thauera linaloolentis (strain DSM 12138 / JCM 21573 / CCUG 41526 / CIP 105981 / IAM 15112 / NBRC 102519 / 47Lol) TaxID=1123367 RepID=N6YGH0_THAL4|nr:S-methyl-5-thioribose-1-phosphate isomerase [Thauera linaloolentis]ENO90615.1 methylthioribose-1-phosphate isomerase [Thauera linaloolentis 47Lol = DSM 12138]MCM8566121.1 S-methyl-5-thioribose-1-phosphate isomerase [Thauera linaloolentis]